MATQAPTDMIDILNRHGFVVLLTEDFAMITQELIRLRLRDRECQCAIRPATDGERVAADVG